MLMKIIGLLLAAIGFLIIKEFPDIQKYQRKEMTRAGIFFGLALLFIGIIIVIFG